nr:MAG TPA: hypothetical protein [Caudoviricetes sp.]
MLPPAYASKILSNPIYRRKAVKRICDNLESKLMNYL